MLRIASVFALALIGATAASSIALGQSLKKIAVLDVGEAHEKEYRGHLSLSPDGRFLATSRRNADQMTLIVWDIAAQKIVGKFESDDPLGSIALPAISSHPVQLAARNILNRDELSFCNLDPVTGRFVPTERSVPIESPRQVIRFSSDGKRLGSLGSEMTLVEAAKPRLLHRFRPRVNISAVAMSPDLRLLAASNFQDADLYDTETGKDVGSLLDHNGSVNALSFRPDGKILAVAACRSDGRARNLVSEIKLWDVVKRKVTATTKEFPGRIGAMIHPYDDVIFASWTEMDFPVTFKFYKVATGQWTIALQLEARGHALDFALSPMGVLALVRGRNVEVWQIVPPENVRKLN